MIALALEFPFIVRMLSMNSLSNRMGVTRKWLLGLALLASGGAILPVRGDTSHNEAPQQVATVEQLKSEAFAALRSGKFDRSNELLGRAAGLSEDPAVRQMAKWTQQFESQRQNF